MLVQPGNIDLDIEMTNVTHDGFVLHRPEMFGGDKVAATGGGNYDVSLTDGVDHTLDFVAVHGRLQCADRVDLGHDDTAAGSGEGGSRALTYITISANHGYLTGQHDVGRAADGIHQGFLTAIFVVELRLGNGVVHVDGGHGQCALGDALIQTMYSGGGLFGDTFYIGYQFRVFVKYHVGEVTTIVQDHVERTIGATKEQGLLDAPVSLFVGLTFPGENTDACGSDRSSGMVLGGEDVARAPFYFGTEGYQRFNEHGGLDGHVQAAGDAGSLEGLRSAIFGTERHQAGHFRLSETDLLAAPFCEADIFHLVGQGEIDVRKCCHGHKVSLIFCKINQIKGGDKFYDLFNTIVSQMVGENL